MIVATADVAVIGAGPGGLSAATAAAKAGANVHVIDAAPTAGGQYWMQRHDAAATSPQSAAGAGAIAAARAAGVTFHLGAEVWAIFPDRRICAVQAGNPLDVRARTIVIAAGAHDRNVPFPGWTLPGVITAGAAQRLAKLDAQPAGKRVVVAGSGPFLLPVAAALRAAGAELAAFVEARRPGFTLARHLARFPGRWLETAALVGVLTAPRTQRRLGWIVTAALGRERVEAVAIAPLAAGGAIDFTRARTIEGIDALVIGWGFRPSIELTALLRCAHAFDEARGGWYCLADPTTGQTSVEAIFAVGEVCGIAGARPAQLAGELAGRAAAAAAGFPSPIQSRMGGVAGRRLRRARAFAAGLNALFVPPDAIHTLAAEETIVCRCEEVTHGEIRRAAEDGAATVAGVKRMTRAGMGACQGRICSWAVAHALADGASAEPAGWNAPRIPVRPVALSVVAQALGDDPD